MSEPTLANGWEALGLPSPEMSSYHYRVDTGLLRTPFETPRPRQRRKHTSWNRAFSLTFQLSQAELQLAESALTSDGYSWFSMKLISGDGVLVDHRVRLFEPWQVSALSPMHFTLTLQVEMFSVSTFYYSPPYPFELSEAVISGAPEGFSGNFYTPVIHDFMVAEAPSNFGGTLALTVAWRYLVPDRKLRI